MPNVTYDTPAVASGNAGSVTIAYTVAGSDRALEVGVALWDLAGVAVVSSVTWNGTPLTQKKTARSVLVSADIWQLIAPAVGSFNVVVTFSVTAKFVVGVQALRGVNQTTPTRRHASFTGSSTTPAATITSTVEHDTYDVLAANELSADSLTATAGASQTQNWNAKTAGLPNARNVLGASSNKAGAVAGAMSWTLSASTDWVLLIMDVLPILSGDAALTGTGDVSTAKAQAIHNAKSDLPGSGDLSTARATVVHGAKVEMTGDATVYAQPEFPEVAARVPVEMPVVLYVVDSKHEVKLRFTLAPLDDDPVWTLDSAGVVLRVPLLGVDLPCTVEDMVLRKVSVLTTVGQFAAGTIYEAWLRVTFPNADPFDTHHFVLRGA